MPSAEDDTTASRATSGSSRRRCATRFLVLAQAPGGLSCFFLPRLLPDGALNAIRIQRLKDKLGNRANASSEVEFHGARAWLARRRRPRHAADSRDGHVDAARLRARHRRPDAPGAGACACTTRRQRNAFGKPLIDQPLMKNVLADLALEVGGRHRARFASRAPSTRQTMRTSSCCARLLTPAAKFWICKRGAHFAQEAMEVPRRQRLCGGGRRAGAHLSRDAAQLDLGRRRQHHGLDLLRALRKQDAVDAVINELDTAKGSHAAYDHFCMSLKDRLANANEFESAARRLTQDIALAMQAGLLARHAPRFVFDAFVESRLRSDWSGACRNAVASSTI